MVAGIRAALGRAVVQVQRHPRLPRALKAGIAAMIAWLAVLPMGGLADTYPYYAPLGAVIATSNTVSNSIRESIQSVSAIFIGAAIAVVCQITPLGTGISVAIVVTGGTLAAGWSRLGAMGSWVPFSGLFVLIIGAADTEQYVAGYLGLTAFGAAIGAGLNAIFPPLPLGVARESINWLRDKLADQLEDLAEAFGYDEDLSTEQWQHHKHALTPPMRDMRYAVSQAEESRRGNWRASRWRNQLERQNQHAHAMETLTLAIEDMSARIAQHYIALGAESRLSAANAFHYTAKALRAGDALDNETHRAAQESVTDFADTVKRNTTEIDSDVFDAGIVISALKQVVQTLDDV